MCANDPEHNMITHVAGKFCRLFDPFADIPRPIRKLWPSLATWLCYHGPENYGAHSWDYYGHIYRIRKSTRSGIYSCTVTYLGLLWAKLPDPENQHVPESSMYMFRKNIEIFPQNCIPYFIYGIIITFRIARCHIHTPGFSAARRHIHTPEFSTASSAVEFFRKIVFCITCFQIIISFRFARPYIHAPEFYAAVWIFR